MQIRKDHDVLSREVSALKSKMVRIQDGVKKDFESCVEEFQGRVTRLNNLIFHGVPEQTSGTIEERNKWDKSQIDSIMDNLNIVGVAVSDCKRIGKSQVGRPRLLKITVSDVNKKNEILKKASSLRNTDSCKRIFVHQDLTPYQQAQEKKLRDELKMRRQNGEDVVIYRGKVIRRSCIQNFQ